jgi:hypothetical protein
VDPTWAVISPVTMPAAVVEAASAVASARATHRPRSSSTATPSTTLANRVLMIPSVLKMWEITGMDVTETAIANTRAIEPSAPFGPASRSSGRIDASPSPKMNGRVVPIASRNAVGRRFSDASTRRAADPDTNIRSNSPRLYIHDRTDSVTLPSTPNTDPISGTSRPRTADPKSTPARISPMILGWPALTNRCPTRLAIPTMIASARQMVPISAVDMQRTSKWEQRTRGRDTATESIAQLEAAAQSAVERGVSSTTIRVRRDLRQGAESRISGRVPNGWAVALPCAT